VVSFAILTFVVVAVLVTIGMFFYAYYFPQLNVSQLTLAVFGISFVIGTLLSNIFTGLFQAEDNFFSGNVSMACVNGLLITLLLILQSFGVTKITLLLTYFLFFVVQGFIIAGYYFLKVKPIKNIIFPNKQESKLLIKYSLLALAGNVIFFLVYRVDFWFVHKNCTASNLGNYIQASKMGQMLFILPQILASVVFTKAADNTKQCYIRQEILIITRLIIQCFLVVAVISILFGKVIFTSIFGNTFNTMNLSFCLLLPGILSLSILSLLSAYFSGLNQIKVNITGAILALLVILVGDVLFVKPYGIIAAALISSVGYTVNVAYSFIRFFQQNDLHIGQLIDFKKSDYRWALALLTNKTD
jgi:O-antigen/teichoic acid export membrane protein